MWTHARVGAPTTMMTAIYFVIYRHDKRLVMTYNSLIHARYRPLNARSVDILQIADLHYASLMAHVEIAN